MRNHLENQLTTRLSYDTFVLIAREVWYLDATAKKIVNELQSVERQIRALQTRASSLKDALAVAGLRPDNEDTIFSSGYEAGYISEQPFVHMSLVDSCKRVLLDYKPTPLLKSQIEYLVRVGGCKFDTEDSKNSVGTTLLRLAENEFCKVERNRGPEGNKYWVEGIASKTDSK